jgi:SAM-dependent methyltransferase
MKERLVEILRCPDCSGKLALAEVRRQAGDVESGLLRCVTGAHSFPVRNGIPRFVPADNYASNFGLQWKRYGRVQIDSYSGNTISRTRFLATTGWTADTVSGRLVLDGGCGGGRFAEVALSLGAEVVALDYSEAIDACKENLGDGASRLHWVQADLLKLPFAPGAFDAAYSMGVLQHTPDVRRSFLSLVGAVKPGGHVVADVYEKSIYRYLNSIYWYRPFLRRLPSPILFKLVQLLTATLGPVKEKLMKGFEGHPALRLATCMVLPVNAHHYQFPFLSERQAKDWAILNTFDAYSPRFDYPQDRKTMSRWAEEVGLVCAEVFVDPGKGDGTALVCRGYVQAEPRRHEGSGTDAHGRNPPRAVLE